MARVTCDTCVIAAIELWVSASCSLLLTKRSSWNVMHTRCFTFVYLNFVSVFKTQKEKRGMRGKNCAEIEKKVIQ